VKALTIPNTVPSALQRHDLDEHVALDRALGGIDVGDCNRPILNEGLHFLQRATENLGDVRALVRLSQADCVGEVVLFEELRELGRELDAFLLGLAQ
jgi:hypothetical protein